MATLSSDEDGQVLRNAKLFNAIRIKKSEKTIIEEIKKCLQDGADINAKNTKDKTVLDIAVEKNYKDVVAFLVKAHEIKTNTSDNENDIKKIIDSKDTEGDGKIELNLVKDSSNNQDSENYNQINANLANLLNLQLPLPNENITFTRSQLRILKQELLIAAQNGEKDNIAFLIHNSTDINYRNKNTEQSAIDLAWENEHYDVVLTLLEADSNFPQDFTLENLYADDTISDVLKEFVREREEFHQWIKNNKLKKVREFISKHQVSKFLNNKNQSALEVAAKHSNNVDILASLLGLQLPLPSGKITLTNAQFKNLNRVDEKGNTLLSIAAQHGKKDNVDFLIKCGIDINSKNKLKKRAVDIAWKDRNYSIVLLLMEADSDFPDDFSPNDLNINDNIQKQLKQYIECREELHTLIKQGDLQQVKEWTAANSRLKFYLNSEGKSPSFTAIKNNQYIIYAFLKSIGVCFKNEHEEECITNLSDGEKNTLKESMIPYFTTINRAHVFYLISKSRPKKPIEKFTDMVQTIYEKLDSIPEISIILKVVQYADYLDIVFDFGNKNIKDINPTASDATKGTTDYKDGRIYIAANIEENKLLGTLAHELTHLAMYIIYQNDCNPFDTSNNSKMQVFAEITEKIKKDITDTVKQIEINSNIEDSPIITLARAFRYPDTEQQSELVVRIPHILAQYNDERTRLLINTNEQLKLLFDYYNDRKEGGVTYHCEKFIENSFLIKPKNKIQILNESVGEINNIIKCKIHFRNPIDLDKFLESKQQVFLLKTKSTVLSILSIYQSLINKNYSIQDSLFLKFNSYIERQTEINKGFYSLVGKVLCITCSYDLDQDKLSDVVKTLNALLKQKSNKKIIFVIPKDKDLKEKDKILPVFNNNLNKDEYLELEDKQFNLNDLENNSQEKLLRMQVSFQEKKIYLNELIDKKDKTVKKIVDAETLKKLINNEEIKIGNELLDYSGYDEDYYIQRTFNNQIEITRTIHEDYKNRKFTDLLSYDKTSFKQLCREHPQLNIHLFDNKSKKLIWQESQGSIVTLVDYRDENKDINYVHKQTKRHLITEADLIKHENKIFIISDTAGMGKSTILTSLLKQLKQDNPNLWVIRIDLNNYTTVLNQELEKRSFSNKDVNSVVNFLLDNLLASQEQSKITTKLEYELIKSSINGQGKIALLFDGFDEISPDYQDVVIDVLQALKQSKVEKLFVTTRPNVRKLLEEKLEVFAYELKPFDDKDQLEFLTNFWTKNLESNVLNQEHKERLKTYAESLIKKFSTSINDEEQEFISIPLQMMMLAEIFQEKQEGTLVEGSEEWEGCKEFLTNNTNKNPKLPEKFDLLKLYEQFVQKKFFKFYFEEKQSIDFTKSGTKKITDNYCKNLKKDHEKLALSTLFNDKDLKVLLSAAEIQELNDLIEDIKNAKRNEGIIDNIIDKKPHFVHRTFAEYFATNFFAQYLYENPQKAELQKFILTEILVKPEYKIIRAFLSAKLGKKKLPQNILTIYADKINELWNSNKEQLCSDGKTILYLAIEENNNEMIKFLLDSISKCDKTLKDLINTSDKKGNTVLVYAVHGARWDVVRMLVDYGADVNATDCWNGSTPLHFTLVRNQSDLVTFLLERGANIADISSPDMMRIFCFKAARDEHELIISMLTYMNIKQIVDVIKNLMNTQILKQIDSDSPGQLKAVSLNNNVQDQNNGVVNKRISCNEWLRDRDVDINTQDKSQLTSLVHDAIDNAQWEAVQWLLEHGADVNVAACWDNNLKLIHRVSVNDQWELVKWLVEHGADVNAKDPWEGSTVLHTVAFKLNFDLVKWLVKPKVEGGGGADVNAKDGWTHSTLLHWCVFLHSSDLVEYLIKHGADVSIKRDEDRSTVLHWAAANQLYSLVQDIVNSKPVFSKLIKNSDFIQLIPTQSWLYRKVINCCIKIIPKKLIKAVCNFIINKKKKGDAVLPFILSHIKEKYGQDSEQYKDNINACNSNGDTPLIQATKHGQIKAAQLLLECGADFHITNEDGKSALDYVKNKKSINLLEATYAKFQDKQQKIKNLLDNTTEKQKLVAKY